jgi:glycosyltransferase involved in cell wall biosynthesis
MYDRFKNTDSNWQKSRNWVSYQKTRLYERKTFAQFDLVTMVSKQDKLFSERHVCGTDVKVDVVPNGVDCRFNRPGLASPVPGRLVYSGALTYSVNFDAMDYFLQEIYPLIKRKVPSVSLVITGSLEGVKIEQLALDDSISLTGYVDDIRREIASAMALVVPLRVGGGSRLKILEAMALGTPVVATTKGVEGLDVRAGKDLLITDDPMEFADQTVRLLLEEDLRQGLISNGRRTVQTQYDWQLIGRKYANLIEKTRCSVQP